jgi:2-C-methyl-D-erythritol 4-phosphate cytidylyltransferase
LQTLQAVPAIERVVVALPAGVSPSSIRIGAERVAPPGSEIGAPNVAEEVIGVPGGAVRSESVRLALAAADGRDSDLVLVHDAARPLLTAELVESVLAAAGREGVDGAIAAAPVTDTIKRADVWGVVVETLERSGLWAVQTPQVFRRAALERALDVPAEVLARATDDAWLLERAGGCVMVVSAPRENLKVTTPLDLALAERLLADRSA